jgi:hypothetical protein
MNMTDCAGLQYDWRLRLSRLNMTDFDLAKYDWRRRECGGGSGDYHLAANVEQYGIIDALHGTVRKWHSAVRQLHPESSPDPL